MGNETSIASSSPQTTADLLRSISADFPEFVPQNVLANFKIFKVVHCAHENFPTSGVVAKAFLAAATLPGHHEDDEASRRVIEAFLSPHVRKVVAVRGLFSSLVHPNVLPFELPETSSKSALLFRQYFGKNLHERIYSHPELSVVQKLWISFQLLCAVCQLHSVGLGHGDIKLENCFISGTLHCVLTDFALFKPVRFPADDPVALFSLFFEGELKKKKCYVAPERFVSGNFGNNGSNVYLMGDERFSEAVQKMDYFSVGCSLAELFLDGRHIVDLPELLHCRTGGFDLSDSIRSMLMRDEKTMMDLSSYLREEIVNVICSLVEKDVSRRPSLFDVLESEKIFPCSFKSFLLPFYYVTAQKSYQNADIRMTLVRANLVRICSSLIPGSEIGVGRIMDFDYFTLQEIYESTRAANFKKNGQMLMHPILSRKNCMHFSSELFALWKEGVQMNMAGNPELIEKWKDSLVLKISELYGILFRREEEEDDDIPKSECSSASLEVFLAFLSSTAAACNFVRSRLIYVQIVVSLAPYASQSTLLDILIPYVHDLAASDPSMVVRAKAIKALGIFCSYLTKPETGLFSDYLFPVLLSSEVAVAHPVCIQVAESAIRLARPFQDFDKKLAAIKIFLERAINRIIASVSVKSLVVTPTTRIEFIRSLKRLCHIFSGDRFIENVLLPSIANMINESSPIVRAACCRLSADSHSHIGRVAVEGIILPCLLQGLSDPDERIIVSSFMGLRSLVAARILKLPFLVSVVEKSYPFLFHPNSLMIVPLTEELLTCELAAVIPQVDQIVFLKEYFPGNCKCLDELAEFVDPPLPYEILEKLRDDFSNNFLVPFQFQKQVEQLRTFVNAVTRIGKTSTSATGGAVTSEMNDVPRHSLTVQILNGNFLPLKDFLFVASLEDFLKPTCLKTESIPGRAKSLCLPGNPLPVGHLSQLDGSFMTFYGPKSQQILVCSSSSPSAPQPSLQRLYLSSFPGVRFSSPQGNATTAATLGTSSYPYKPEGILLTTLYDFSVSLSINQSQPVVSIDCTDDGRVLVGATSTGLVHAYRLSGLDKGSVMTPAKSVNLSTSIRKLRVLRNSKSVAIATPGSIGIHRLDLGSPTPISRLEHSFGETIDLVQFDTSFESLLFSVTRKGKLFGWDFRTNCISTSVTLGNGCFSLPSSMVVLRDCFTAVVGFFSGKISIFDLRYDKNIRSFRMSMAKASVVSLANSSLSSPQSSLWVSTNSPSGDMCLFNLDSGGVPLLSYFVNDSASLEESHAPVSIPHLLPCETHGKVGFSDFDEIPRDALCGNFTCRKMIPFATNNLLSAHNDGIVRFWSPSTSSVSTLPRTLSGLKNSVCSIGSMTAMSQQSVCDDNLPEGCGKHKDAILDMCLSSLQFDMVATAGRDGLVKIWK